MKPWSALTQREVEEIQDKVCKGCQYMIVINNKFRCCNYILATGHMRGCDPRECNGGEDYVGKMRNPFRNF